MPNLLTKVAQLARPSDDKDKDKDDPIPAGMTNAALGSSASVVIAELLGFLEPDLYKRILGEDVSEGSRAALTIAILAAGALIIAADVLARGYAAAHHSSSPPKPASDSDAAAGASDTGGMATVTYTKDGDSPGWTGWNLLSTTAEHALIIKKGEILRQVPLNEIEGE